MPLQRYLSKIPRVEITQTTSKKSDDISSDDEPFPPKSFLNNNQRVGTQFASEKTNVSTAFDHNMQVSLRKKQELGNAPSTSKKKRDDDTQFSSCSDKNFLGPTHSNKGKSVKQAVRNDIEEIDEAAIDVLPPRNRASQRSLVEKQQVDKQIETRHNECCNSEIVKILKAQQKQINALASGDRYVDNNNNDDEFFDEILPLKTFPKYLQFQERIKTDKEFQNSFVYLSIHFICLLLF